jgi:hypothetical protein
MVARNIRSGRTSGAARASGPARPTLKKPNPAVAARKTASKDVTEYADKPATGYHKAFAKWIVQEVGYDPDSASSLRAAFLKGVSIATAARPAFNASDAVEEYREKSGEAKRGPKPAAAKAPASRRKAAPVVDEDDDFDEEDDTLDDAEDESDDDDFDEEDDNETDSDDEDDDFDEEEPEEAPAPVRRTKATSRTSRPASGTASTRKGAPAKKAAAPARRTKAAAPADDDEFIF